jgi:hypothetical protein
MIKTTMTLALGILIGVLLINYVFNRPDISNKIVKELQLKNDSLLKANLELDTLNYNLNVKLKEEDYQLNILVDKDKNLESTINQLNISIKTLNNKYEKASNYSNNYNNNEISSYFSNLR